MTAEGFSAERLLAHRFPEIRHAYTARDAILYALGIGLGEDPLDPADLRFLDERALSVLPTYAVTLASPGLWVKEPSLGIDWVRLLHIAQAARFENPLPAKAEVIGHAKIASVVDRGKDRGAEIIVERRIADAETGATYCVLQQTLLLRGNGGFAAVPASRPEKITPPDRAPDHSITVPTSPRMALIYRLSGDWNPLHLDPEIAQKAGFERPILQGLGSYGLAGWVILKALGAAEPSRLKTLSLRFSATVTPGEALTFSLWQSGNTVDFIAKVGERTVLDQGRAELV